MASKFQESLEMTMFVISFPYYFYQIHLKKKGADEKKDDDDD